MTFRESFSPTTCPKELNKTSLLATPTCLCRETKSGLSREKLCSVRSALSESLNRVRGVNDVCFRPFMSLSRLEKHMAGYHASSGTHHCGLCGNRFKYDYNLLYHYRRSCPYTKAFIDR